MDLQGMSIERLQLVIKALSINYGNNTSAENRKLAEAKRLLKKGLN